MKAVSLKQPWAWLVVHGYKDIENRTWKTNLRGKVLIHASLGWDNTSYLNFSGDYVLMPPKNEIERGGIVGEVEIIDCVNNHDSDWFEGPYGLVLRNAKPLPFRPYKGKLGFFEIA